MSKKISLKQFLMKTGRFEKVYDCINSIRSGKISINNQIITNPNYFFNPKTALVKLDNEKIKSVKKFYFILNKPAGYLSQKSVNEKTIYDILGKLNLSKERIQSLFAVGRLDKDTEGLMILTNDGILSAKLNNPESEIIKKYQVVLKRPITTENVKLLEKGAIIEIDNLKYKTMKCKIKKIKENEVYISITEGKKRQIRKMFQTVGNEVAYLKRVSIGGLQLGNLKSGEIKEMEKDEIYKTINPD